MTISSSLKVIGVATIGLVLDRETENEQTAVEGPGQENFGNSGVFVTVSFLSAELVKNVSSFMSMLAKKISSFPFLLLFFLYSAPLGFFTIVLLSLVLMVSKKYNHQGKNKKYLSTKTNLRERVI